MPPPCYVCQLQHLKLCFIFFLDRSPGLCGCFCSCRLSCLFGGVALQFCFNSIPFSGIAIRANRNLALFTFFVPFSHVQETLRRNNNKGIVITKILEKKPTTRELLTSGQITKKYTVSRLVILIDEAKPFWQTRLLNHSAFLQDADRRCVFGIHKGGDPVKLLLDAL